MAKAKDDTTADQTTAATSADTAGEQTGSVDQTKTADQTNTDTGADQTGAKVKKSEVDLITVSVRHKTIYPVYRRAGLVLRGIAKEERVTAEQLETLKSDPWVEVKEVATK